jgi:hypothetical protein
MKGIAVTAAIALAVIALYHKGMIPGLGDAKTVK